MTQPNEFKAFSKQKCAHCSWCGTSADVLRSTSPFDQKEELWGCPKCKSVNTLYLVCDEQGCCEYSTIGTPTPAGYRTTCAEHCPKL